MVDEPEVEEDEVPMREVVPIEDLDKIEKLLDVSLSTKDMPNLPHIKQACMEELAQIDAALAEQQEAANEAFQKEMAEYDAKQAAKREAERKAAAKAELEAKKKAEADAEKALYGPDAPPPTEPYPEPVERRV